MIIEIFLILANRLRSETSDLSIELPYMDISIDSSRHTSHYLSLSLTLLRTTSLLLLVRAFYLHINNTKIT